MVTATVVASKDTQFDDDTRVYENRVVGVTVCVVLVSLFQLLPLHAIGARVRASERVNIWEFCTSCCWYVCLFSLPYCRLIIFTGIFSCFTLDPCLVVCTHTWIRVRSRFVRVWVSVFDERFLVLLLWKIFNIKWIYKNFQAVWPVCPYEKQTKIMIWMCVPVSLHDYTQAPIHTQTNTFIHFRSIWMTVLAL